MTDPITPPPELFKQWQGMPRSLAFEAAYRAGADQQLKLDAEQIAQAYQKGADRELEACVSYVDNMISGNKARALRAARRPKPPSLKEQALSLLAKTDGPIMLGNPEYRLRESEVEIIRRALNELPE